MPAQPRLHGKYSLPCSDLITLWLGPDSSLLLLQLQVQGG